MLHLFYYSINHYWIYFSVIHKRRKIINYSKNCIRETELWDEPGTQIDVPGFYNVKQ